MIMMRIEHIEHLYLLGLIVVIALLFLTMMMWRKKAARKFGELKLIKRLYPEVSNTKHIVKFILGILIFAFIVVALTNPQIGTKMEKIKREGVDVMIAVDVSKSMKAEDIKPNRLVRAKRFISSLVDQMESDRIGIIVYAGKAYLQLPLTTDYSAVKMFLKNIDTDIVPTQGTAIGEAVNLAIRSFKAGETEHKALIIITDGENHEDNAIEAAQKAVDDGAVIHTIGMGTVQGGPIPVYRRRAQIGFLQDMEGNIVVSKLNESLLQQIASIGEGKYIHTNNTTEQVESVLKALAKMEKKEFETRIYTDYEDKFQYFIAVALLFLIIDFFVSERKSKWISKLNLFKEK